MKLLYKNEDEDIKFIISYLNRDLAFEKSDATKYIHENETYCGVSEILKFLIKDEKKVKEAMCMRSGNEQCVSNDKVIKLMSLYHTYKNFLVSPSLKNKEYLLGLLSEFGLSKQLFYFLDIQVGEIVDISDLEGSDKLYVEQVEFKDRKQIVSGLRNMKKKEELINKKFLFITNIKKSNIKGTESNGMILCAKNENNSELFNIDSSIPSGQFCVLEDSPRIVDGYFGTKIDLKKEFYSSIFKKLKLKDGYLVFEDSKLCLGNMKIQSNIQNGDIS